MTLVESKELLEVAKLLLESIAIISGGIWAAYTFGSLRQIARARAEIANTESARRKTEAEIAQLTEHARVGAVIETDLIATACKIPGEDSLYLSVIADIVNKGNRNAQIEYPANPFTVYAVTDLSKVHSKFTVVANAAVRSSIDPSKRSLRLLVRAGGRERIPFFVPIPAPGLYFLALSLPLSEAEQKVAEQYGFVSAGRWSAKRYFVATVPTAT
jgi:hypothetical protein